MQPELTEVGRAAVAGMDKKGKTIKKFPNPFSEIEQAINPNRGSTAGVNLTFNWSLPFKPELPPPNVM